MTEAELAAFKTSIDAASLVFMHSALITTVMYFGAAYVVPKRPALAAVLVAAYFVFAATTIVRVLYFRH